MCSDFIQLGNERYVLLWTRWILHHYLQLYDVIQDTVVRKGYIGKDLDTLELSMTHITGSLVACVVGRRLLMMDVDKMEVTMVFEGQTHDRHYGSPPVLVDGGKNLLVFSESGEHLKAYSLETGKEVYTIQQDTEEPLKMEQFMVNHSATFALAEASHGCSGFTLVAFDLRHRTFGGVVRGAEVGQQYLRLDDWRVAVTEMVTRKLTDPEATDIMVTDSERGLESFYLVDDTTVIAGYSDKQIRVFDIDTGSVLHRLPGHQTCTRIFSAPDSGLLVSVDWESDAAEFRVWRKRDFTRVTTLHTDSPVRIVKLLLVDGGKGFILSSKHHSNPTQFTLQGRDKVRLLGSRTALTSTPVLYSGYNGCVKVADFTTQDEDGDDVKG